MQGTQDAAAEELQVGLWVGAPGKRLRTADPFHKKRAQGPVAQPGEGHSGAQMCGTAREGTLRDTDVWHSQGREALRTPAFGTPGL